jgi:FMN phosphatase YigB (HAD superfamily)
MLKAILFDLDNTLIYFDELTFYKKYLFQVSQVFADLMPFDLFQKKLLLATQALMDNHGKMSNAEYFMSIFCNGFEAQRDEIWKRFMRFYERGYDQFRTLVSVPKGISEVFLQLRRENLKLVIASNPMWPLDVQMKRLSWAGLGDFHFDLVTHIENMSHCKPRIEYYEEICLKLDERPEACLMVGNDPINDMIVATIGMRTFLVTDSPHLDESSLEMSRKIRIDPKTDIPVPDFKGALSDVPHAVDFLLKNGRRP